MNQPAFHAMSLVGFVSGCSHFPALKSVERDMLHSTIRSWMSREGS